MCSKSVCFTEKLLLFKTLFDFSFLVPKSEAQFKQALRASETWIRQRNSPAGSDDSETVQSKHTDNHLRGKFAPNVLISKPHGSLMARNQ